MLASEGRKLKANSGGRPCPAGLGRCLEGSDRRALGKDCREDLTNGFLPFGTKRRVPL